MAIIHGYIDTANGNMGYAGDLAVTEDTYTDDSQDPKVLTGKTENLKYVRVGRHTFAAWERLGLDARWNAIQKYPAFISDTPTSVSR